MFSVHNERGRLSETDSMSGALVAAYTHLVDDGETPPLVIVFEKKPRALVTWLPAGSASIARFQLVEGG